MDSSSIYPFLLTFAIIELPSIFITYKVITYQLYPQIIATFLILMQIIATCSLVCCVYTDPGILPQIVDKYQWDQDHALIPAVDHRNLMDHKYLIVTNSLYAYQKYCIQCCIYRPLRTIHCHACNHCVQLYDHHCPWLGMCIGKFNYKYFFAFITASFVLSIVIFGVSVKIIVDKIGNQPIYHYIGEVIVGGASVVFMAILFKLFTYHVQLFYRRQTTNEDLKKIYKVLNNTTPFERCRSHQRQVLAPLNSKLVMGGTVYVEMKSQKTNSIDITPVHHSKRFSALVEQKEIKRNLFETSQL